MCTFRAAGVRPDSSVLGLGAYHSRTIAGRPYFCDRELILSQSMIDVHVIRRL